MPDPLDVAFTLHSRDRLAEAEAAYRAIIAAEPASIPARNNLVALLQSQSRWDDEIDVLRELSELQTEPWTTRLWQALLTAGRYAEGWPVYERRTRQVGVPPLPEWKGEPVKSLLLWPDQGMGDVIQFARYVPLLKARGIAVSALVQPALVRLFAPLGIPVYPASSGVRVPSHEAWALFGSLPGLFGTTVETIPPPVALRSEPRLSSGRIGITHTGNPRHWNNANRSLDPQGAARLLSLPSAINLDPRDTGARDMQDTADIIGGLDLVVTTCTSVAHLAGSLGKRTFVLLPAANADWRWFRDRTDSPWYPSARLFRQPSPGDWPSVLDEVTAALRPALV